MRLKESEISAIKNSVAEQLPGAEVFLFGSRANDNERGGDIDLIVYTPNFAKVEFEIQTKILWAIYDKIGEQKIDIIYTDDLYKTDFLKLVATTSIKL